MNRRALLSSIGAAALEGCSGLTDGPDPTPTEKRTSTKTPPTRTTEPERTPTEPPDVDAVWTFDHGGLIDGFVDGAVFAREYWLNEDTDDARVVALDKTTGELRWHYGSAYRYEFYSELTVEDAVFFGRRDDAINGGVGAVYAIESDGTERWVYEETSSVDQPPRLVDGTLYTAGDVGLALAFDPADGEVRWRNDGISPAISGTSRLLAVEDVVYVKSNLLFGLDRDDGEVLWSYGDEDSISRLQVTIADGRAYVANEDRGVALVAADGTEVWRREFDATLRVSAANE